MPKRKIEDVELEESDSCGTLPDCFGESNDDSNESANSVGCGSGQPRKKLRKSVNFEQVEVYYFPRAQGFACVPSQGGTTLGMSEKHARKEEYPLKHYRKLRKLVRRKKADVEESAENSFSIDAINDISQDEIVQTDSEEDDTETDGFFLQPVPIRLRRSLLKLSGVKKVDATEREECKELRGSREECGCDCKTECHPETCLCAINGIQCQVDRFSFPCGCTKKYCANPSGRIEFNPIKVRKHYQHTMTRLQHEELQGNQVDDSEQNDSNQNGKGNHTDYSAAKKAKHIRFTDEGDMEGEPSLGFNSTDSGCCLDCSLTNCTASFAVNISDSAQSSVECFSVSDQLIANRGEACVANNSTFPIELALLSNSMNSQVENANCTSETLEPMSDLLNPILNTVDSLDMYSLPNLHHHAEALAENDNGDQTVSEWQSLSHESLLTTNSLIPMKDSDEESSSQSSCNKDDLTSIGIASDVEQPLSFTGLKSSPVSFQLQSSHNVVHALHSEFGDLDQCKSSLVLPTEAST